MKSRNAGIPCSFQGIDGHREVIKVIVLSLLVENRHLNSNTKHCEGGGMNIFTSNELYLTQEGKKMNLWEAFAMCLLNVEG